MLEFEVFGRRVLIEREERGWRAYYPGPDGKRRDAVDVILPRPDRERPCPIPGASFSRDVEPRATGSTSRPLARGASVGVRQMADNPDGLESIDALRRANEAAWDEVAAKYADELAGDVERLRSG